MKKICPYIRCVVFLIGFVFLMSLCDYLFAPSGYIRFILHEVNSTQEDYDTIILGSSHGRSAINPEKIDEQLGWNTINYSIPGSTVKDSYYLLKEACEKNDVKRVIMDVDYQYWFSGQPKGEFGEPFIYTQMKFSKAKLEYMLDNMSTMDIRNFVSKRCNYKCSLSTIKNNLILKSKASYKNYEIEGADVRDADGPYIGRGFFSRHVSGYEPGGEWVIQHWAGRENGGLDMDVVSYFGRMKEYCDDNGIELICITSPITPSSMKRLGMSKVYQTFESDLFNAWNVPYYDFNLAKMSVLPRTDKDYGDLEGHMGGNLAEQYSTMLGKLLKDKEAGTLDSNSYFYSSYNEMYQNMENDYDEAVSVEKGE